MSTVVDAAAGDEGTDRDPFGDSSIEVPEAEVRRVSPSAWLAGLKRRLDVLATRFAYGR